MLVLTRKQGETIRVGENIEIKVIRMEKGSVRIGIVAPKDVRILRGELVFDPTIPFGDAAHPERIPFTSREEEFENEILCAVGAD